MVGTSEDAHACLHEAAAEVDGVWHEVSAENGTCLEESVLLN